MSTPNSSHAQSGQILLLGVLILAILLVAIPAIVFLNQAASRHSINTQKRLKGRAIAEEGVAFAIQQMTAAANLSCLSSFDGITPIKSSQGGAYTISCAANTPQSYETTLTVVPKDTVANPTNPPTIAGSSIQTIVSRRTIGIKLPTGLATPVAVRLGLTPSMGSPNPDFRVFWGPIEVVDPTTPPPVWTVVDVSAAIGMNRYQFPRKFSVGPITGEPATTAAGTTTDPGASLVRCNTDCSCATPSDQKEYWACASLGVDNPIDLTTYANSAISETTITPPRCNSAAPLTPTVIPTTPNGGYFDLTSPASGCPNGIAYFYSGYTVPTSNSVIYVNGGTAQFENGIQIDMKQGGAFIATGNLIANTVGMPNGAQSDIRVPPTGFNDVPYSATAFNPASPVTCLSLFPALTPGCQFPFRGFLYVQQNMHVQGNSTFGMSGVLRVDQQLTVDTGNIFRVYYDDQINHSILTTNFELQVDSTTALP